MQPIRFVFIAVIIALCPFEPSRAAPEPLAGSAAVAETASAGDPTAAPSEAKPKSEKPQRVVDILIGGGWIMIPLAAISVWCLALIIESSVRIRLRNFAPPETIGRLRKAFAEENYQEAWRICKASPSFLTNTLRHALESIGQGREACAQALAEHTLKESMIFRTKISYLSTIGVISPMVGLLGTVTGMVKAFQTLGRTSIFETHLLAAAIGEVLIATATGLMVAIPAFFTYYFFRNRLQASVVLAEDLMNQLMRRVKYSELQGVLIGEDFETGASPDTPSREPPPKSSVSQRISQRVNADAVVCPECHAPILPGVPACPNCGVELQWEIPAAGIQHLTV